MTRQQSMGILDKKIVLITGTGGGMGRVAAHILREREHKSSGATSMSMPTTRPLNSYVVPAVR